MHFCYTKISFIKTIFYIKCNISSTNESFFPFEDKAYLSGCTGEIWVYSDAYDYDLGILKKIKAFNPDLYIYNDLLRHF